MSRVDLDRNREALARAQTQVADPNNKTDWALFGYEGKTNVLKLIETGDGGLEELVDELSSGKIMYAFCQMQDPNTGLPKNVFINWQGEGVPEIRKGSCANHVHDISKFFKSAHLTINARTEEDVEEDVIKGKLSKASGSNYSVHKEQRRPEDDAPQAPVGSVYQKTRAHTEIAQASRGKFWDEVSQEQSKQKQEEQKRRTEEYQRAEKERKEEEARGASEREKKEADRIRKIREQKAYEKQQEEGDKSAEKENWEKQQRDALRDEDERRLRSEKARKERAAEARALVAQRQNDPKSPFDKKPPSQFDEPTSPTSKGPAPPRKLKHTFLSEDDTPVSLTRKQPIQLPTGDSEPSPPTSPVRKVTPPPASSAPPSKPPRAEPDRPPAPPPARQTSPPPAAPVAPAAPAAQTKNLMSANLPARLPSDDEEEDDQDWEAEDSGKPQAVVAPAAEDLEVYDDVGESAEPLDIYDDTGAAAEPEQELYDDIKAQPEEDTGLCARALYDYQAAEENEITFDPGDIIRSVETIDPGWWLGVAPDGKKGMFPANYVELIQ